MGIAYSGNFLESETPNISQMKMNQLSDQKSRNSLSAMHNPRL